MKRRLGFVSNSSSSSFVVAESHLTKEQLHDLIELCDGPVGDWGDGWSIEISNGAVYGSTIMNNGIGEGGGGLYDWMIENDFPMDKITWEHDN